MLDIKQIMEIIPQNICAVKRVSEKNLHNKKPAQLLLHRSCCTLISCCTFSEDCLSSGGGREWYLSKYRGL